MESASLVDSLFYRKPFVISTILPSCKSDVSLYDSKCDRFICRRRSEDVHWDLSAPLGNTREMNSPWMGVPVILVDQDGLSPFCSIVAGA